MCIFFFSSRRRHTRSCLVSWARRCVQETAYKEVCTDTTGHAEAVHLTFDPSIVTYEQLLDVFWAKHDPTQLNKQGGDIGTQYRTSIFYHSEEQKTKAEASKAAIQAKFNSPVVTEIVPATTFYPAEEYHQRYLEKKGQNAAKECSDPIRCYGQGFRKDGNLYFNEISVFQISLKCMSAVAFLFGCILADQVSEKSIQR
eukprot:TRINITY_DN5623_c0_g1_i5.p2 TRINITY_DN5623_c0_g1~~TRINITY_DN5623_c0_g1_i5.p2  ORF type:complete len:199 (-),score=50.17 TRINITY_DN5623_c0_g1_i5:138-734(-)